MNPARLLVVVLCVFVVLSGINYGFYYERTRALDAQSREAVNSVVINPLGTIVKSADIVGQKQQEYHGMVNREIVLIVLVMFGVLVSIGRRR